jgi:hypothetical protein
VSDAPCKSFTSNKLDLQHRICADRRVTDGQFRMFVRVLRAMNAQTGIAVIGDEAIMAEVPSCGSASTCKANRRRLEELGYWTVKPGSGSTATEYSIDLKAGMSLIEGLEELRTQRIQRRRRKTMAWRARKAVVRHADVGLPDDVVRHPGDGVVRHADVGRSVIQDPPYTFITPSTETPSYQATEESRYHQGEHVDSDGVVIPAGVLSLLGSGDISEGRRLAEFVPANVMAEILDVALKFGPSACRRDIADAREQALSLIARRASA